ncbi:MAG TPA: TraR/DksA C4-type zinc finger protein [Burkholderiales bacterium]|nr:TraR/DksA C4-type zinc finger protein [Burkholderiales bacterium]
MRYHHFTLEQRDALQRTIRTSLHPGRERDEALGRLGEPDYGVCERCGRDIAFVLLEADPAARLCRACGGAEAPGEVRAPRGSRADRA